MAKLLKNEFVISSFDAYKRRKEQRLNMILTTCVSYLFCRGYGGSGVFFKFTLTDLHLYIDTIGYDVTGQLDTIVTEIIDRNQIKSFTVIKEGEEEHITLVMHTRKNKEKTILYTRTNKDASDLATDMANKLSKNNPLLV